MLLEPLGKRDRARYVVDAAVHDLHVLILTQPYASVRGNEAWLNVFCSFPRLDGAKSFLREVAALRDILPPEASDSLDAEIVKVQAAYSLASKLTANNKTEKHRKHQTRRSKVGQTDLP
jgi:hypothetical protein